MYILYTFFSKDVPFFIRNYSGGFDVSCGTYTRINFIVFACNVQHYQWVFSYVAENAGTPK